MIKKEGRLRWIGRIEHKDIMIRCSIVWWWRSLELDRGNAQGRFRGVVSRRIWKSVV